MSDDDSCQTADQLRWSVEVGNGRQHAGERRATDEMVEKVRKGRWTDARQMSEV